MAQKNQVRSTIDVVYAIVLVVSGAMQAGFGLGFLIAPQAVFALGGIEWRPALIGSSINLGCIISFCAVLSFQAFAWINKGQPAGYRVADLFAAMYLALAAFEVGHGLWIPVAIDGGRGALLVALLVARRRQRAL